MAITTIPKALREEFMKIVQSGDEAKARQFLVDHFTVYEHVDGEWNPRRDFAFAAEPRD